MLNKYSSRLILLWFGSLLTACAATPPTHFYTLESQSRSPEAANTPIEKKLLIGIGPLSLPALLDRRQIITRAENNTIQMAEFDQWAAPLKENVLAVLSKNIATLQPNAIVRPYPWSAYGNVDYRIIIDITRLDAQLGKSANLEASWVIMQEKNHRIIGNDQANIEQPLNDASYAGATQALSNILSELSQKLSLALIRQQ